MDVEKSVAIGTRRLVPKEEIILVLKYHGVHLGICGGWKEFTKNISEEHSAVSTGC